MNREKSWNRISIGSPIEAEPQWITPAPVISSLDMLPFNQMPWGDFEKIQWRILRDVEGLRNAHLYGDPGQAQQGLDVVALTPDKNGVALQSKQYKNFGPAQLTAAVKKFRETSRPFVVQRLIIGVSKEVKSTKSVETLHDLRQALHPIQLDLWDQRNLSELLRNHPDIVIQFFGQTTAEHFCLPFEHKAIPLPSMDAVSMREALGRTPEAVTGAHEMIAEADDIESNPRRSLELIQGAQKQLVDAGFADFAAKYEPRITKILQDLDRHEEAARRLLDRFWKQLDLGMSSAAQASHRSLQELIDGSTEESLQDLSKVAATALRLYVNPLGELLPASELQLGSPRDQLCLAVLAGETALANDDFEWLNQAFPVLALLTQSDRVDSAPEIRLKILWCEVSGQWAEILDDTRRRRIPQEWRGLVNARYARYCALRQNFREADEMWEEAAGEACLAEHWSDAERWVLSNRIFRTYWRPFASDELLPLQMAFRDRNQSAQVIPVDDAAEVRALQDLAAEKLRQASISAQRALRDAVATSNWLSERNARKVLASILNKSGEPDLAARHLVRAGDIEGLKTLAASHPLHFINVVADLRATNYWMVAGAYRLLAAQADLIPDELIAPVTDAILIDLGKAQGGELIDLPMMSNSRYLAAVALFAQISLRISIDAADEALSYFEGLYPVADGNSRYSDKDEALILANIALSQPTLARRAITRLVALLARNEIARESRADEAVASNFELARDSLMKLSMGNNHWAQEVIASHSPHDVSTEVSSSALDRLTKPINKPAGMFTIGTNAIGDALLASQLEPSAREPALAELMRRVQDSRIGYQDRGSYLLAASILGEGQNDTVRDTYFDLAMTFARAPSPSEHDERLAEFGHPLGAVVINNGSDDSRAKALYLAATLARHAEQRAQVRSETFVLLAGDESSDYWPTRIFHKLGQTALANDLAFLSVQGWALRCLAAVLWAERGQPTHLGLRLARDNDVRVRVALAESLRTGDGSHQFRNVHDVLSSDPAYSVRAALGLHRSP